MVAYLVSEGYALSDLLDYDRGMPLEDIVALRDEAMKLGLARQKESVTAHATAIASIFSKDVIRNYNRIVDQAMSQLTAGSRAEEPREVTMERSMRELNKLRRILGSTNQRPPWEQ